MNSLDIVYFTRWVPDTRTKQVTWAQQEWHDCNKSETGITQVRHKCDRSATETTRVRHEWKILILTTARVKTYFHASKLAIWQMKGYKEWNNFIQEAPPGNVSFPYQNTFEKCATKLNFVKDKIFVKKLYTRL